MNRSEQILARDIRDQMVRSLHYSEALREAAVLLAIFGPVSMAEIFKSISLTTALVIWSASALALRVGIEWDVNLERRKRKLVARGRYESFYSHSSGLAACTLLRNCWILVFARNRPLLGGELDSRGPQPDWEYHRCQSSR